MPAGGVSHVAARSTNGEASMVLYWCTAGWSGHGSYLYAMAESCFGGQIRLGRWIIAAIILFASCGCVCVFHGAVVHRAGSRERRERGARLLRYLCMVVACALLLMPL